MKFSFTKRNAPTFWLQLEGLPPHKVQLFLDTIREGEEMELIFRKKIRWDIGQMRKFFEGPVCKFVKNCFAERGNSYGKEDVRRFLKQKYLGCIEGDPLNTPVSTTSLDFEGWKEFLKDIDGYCMDNFQCGLPESADEGD
jgi:hypothetical protein